MKKVLTAVLGAILVLIGLWVPSWLAETLPEGYDFACFGTTIMFLCAGLSVVVFAFNERV